MTNFVNSDKKCHNGLSVVALEDHHLRQVWNIVHCAPKFFRIPFRDFDCFLDVYFAGPRKGLVCYKGSELIGVSYIVKETHNGFAEICLAFKRRSLTPSKVFELCIEGLKYYFNKFRYKVIYALVYAENFPVIALLKKLRFTFGLDCGDGWVLASIERGVIV